MVTSVIAVFAAIWASACYGDNLARTNWFSYGGTMTDSPGHLVITTTNTTDYFATFYFATTNAPLTLAQPGNQIKLTWRFTPSAVFTGGTQTPLAFGLINTPDTNRLTADAAPVFGNYAGYSTFTSAYYGQLFYWLQQGSWADPTVPNVLFVGDRPVYGGWSEPAAAANYSGGDTNGVPYTFTMTLTRLESNKLAVNTLVKNDTGFVVQSQYVDDQPNTFAFNTATIYAMSQLSGTFDTTRFDVEFNPVAVSDDARVVVKDTWKDGDRTDPAPPVYSEQGVDADNDGDIESAWFNYNAAGSMVATPGHLMMTMTNGSTSWTTYFAATNRPITLAKAGDRIKVTWAFTPSNVHGGGTSSTLNFGLVNTQSPDRLTTDGAFPPAPYAGYATFMAFGDYSFYNLTLGARTDTSTILPLFQSDYFQRFANWQLLASNYRNSVPNDLPYTYTMSLTRNAAGGLDIESSVVGSAGEVNHVSATDPSPNTFAFNAVSMYLLGGVSGTIDTTLFQVDQYSVPAIQSVTNSGGTIQFTWSTISNLTYQVQCSPDLSQGSWVNFGGTVTATDSTTTVADDATATVQKFYRIILLP